MTQEDKELLLKDLCARLPYSTFVQFEVDGHKAIKPLTVDFFSSTWYHTEFIKPYLRPMSSMTEEEKNYMEELSDFKCTPDKALQKIDFYNLHRIDYRGLILMGLALEAPEDMYK